MPPTNPSGLFNKADGTASITYTAFDDAEWTIHWDETNRLAVHPPQTLSFSETNVEAYTIVMKEIFAYAAELDWMRCYLHQHPATMAGFVPLPLMEKDVPEDGGLWAVPRYGHPHPTHPQFGGRKGTFQCSRDDMRTYLKNVVGESNETSGWFAPHHGEKYCSTGELPPFGTPYLAFRSEETQGSLNFFWEIRQLGFGTGVSVLTPAPWNSIAHVENLIEFASSYTQEDAITLGMLGSDSSTYERELAQWEKWNSVAAARKKFTPKN